MNVIEFPAPTPAALLDAEAERAVNLELELEYLMDLLPPDRGSIEAIFRNRLSALADTYQCMYHLSRGSI